MGSASKRVLHRLYVSGCPRNRGFDLFACGMIITAKWAHCNSCTYDVFVNVIMIVISIMYADEISLHTLSRQNTIVNTHLHTRDMAGSTPQYGFP